MEWLKIQKLTFKACQLYEDVVEHLLSIEVDYAKISKWNWSLANIASGRYVWDLPKSFSRQKVK